MNLFSYNSGYNFLCGQESLPVVTLTRAVETSGPPFFSKVRNTSITGY